MRHTRKQHARVGPDCNIFAYNALAGIQLCSDSAAELTKVQSAIFDCAPPAGLTDWGSTGKLRRPAAGRTLIFRPRWGERPGRWPISIDR